MMLIPSKLTELCCKDEILFWTAEIMSDHAKLCCKVVFFTKNVRQRIGCQTDKINIQYYIHTRNVRIIVKNVHISVE